MNLPRFGAVLVLLMLMTGCSNIKEVETCLPISQEQKGSERYILKEKAVAIISRSKEVINYPENIRGTCVFITEQKPANPLPVYIMRVGEGVGDRFTTCNISRSTPGMGK